MRRRGSTSFHPDSPLLSSLSRPVLAALAAVVGGYGAALAASGILPVSMLFLIGFALAVVVEGLRWRGAPEAVAILLFWAPLHLLILATGSLASPALPLAAAWVVAIGVVRGTYAPWAAAAGASVLLLGSLAAPAPLNASDALRLLLLLGLAAFVPRLLRPSQEHSTRSSDPRPPRGARAAGRDPRGPQHKDTRLSGTPPPRQLLNLVRRATAATEAILWERSPDGASLHPLGWAGPADMPEPARLPNLAGHPFAWALQEQKPVRLERGRKPLPRPSSAEMLLLPFGKGSRLLTLGYSTAAPVASEGAACAAVNALEELGALLSFSPSVQQPAPAPPTAEAGRESATSPLELETFAALLTRATADLSHAEGAALVLWSAEAVQGWVIALTGLAPAMELPAQFGGAESQVAAACDAERGLRLNDRDREAPDQPLLVTGETWEEHPRSAMIRPVRAEGRVIAALLAWDSAPNHFHLRDEEGVDLLASIAAPVLQHTSRELDLFSAGASLLADHALFEARLAGLCGRFHRYSRPFAVVTLDVDHFERINQSWGAEGATLVLHHVALLVRQALREVDLIARPTGAEFVVLLPETTLAAAVSAAERIRHALQTTPFAAHGRQLPLTASFGVAACPDTCTVATDTLAEASGALQRSKREGTNRVSAAAPRR